MTIEESAVESSVSRETGGRFLPGQSGNPEGKAPGTRNRATILRAALAPIPGSATTAR